MGFLQDLFKRTPGRFLTQKAHERALSSQLQMTPETLSQLRTLGVGIERSLSLEYFFYTNTPAKAESLGSALLGLGYTPEIGPSASDKRQSVITGWTPRMPMGDAIVSSWTREMCELGYAHDCEFDGWGTNPQQ